MDGLRAEVARYQARLTELENDFLSLEIVTNTDVSQSVRGGTAPQQKAVGIASCADFSCGRALAKADFTNVVPGVKLVHVQYWTSVLFVGF